MQTESALLRLLQNFKQLVLNYLNGLVGVQGFSSHWTVAVHFFV
jgi:hypothetical protein